MFLLIESPTAEKQKIISKKASKVIFEAVIQSLDTPNRNDRVYSRKVIEEALNDPYVKERQKYRTFGGELDHPIPTSDDKASITRHTTLMFKEASHIFTEIYISGNLVEAVVETLSTPNGRTLAGLISDGVKVGFSLRAVGDNVKKNGKILEVMSPLTIIAYDCVSFPSHKEAYLQEVSNLTLEDIDLSNRCRDGVCMLSEHYNKIKYVSPYDRLKSILRYNGFTLF